ncbi:aminotransferase-like domain-containing protein, partial [Pseudomonas aeruginosa]
HLLHRETRWVGSRYFAKSESLFQSFLRGVQSRRNRIILYRIFMSIFELLLTEIDHSRSSTEPMYVQLAKAISSAINSGRVRPGERLPPHRELASRLNVNITTITRTMSMLQEANLVDTRPGRGTVVCTPPPDLRLRGAQFQPASTTIAGLIDLSINRPATDAYNHVLASILPELPSDPRFSSMKDYHLSEGPVWAREAAASWLRSMGVSASAPQIVICEGAQHGLSLVLRAITKPGETILADEVTYQGISSLCRTLGLNIVGVGSDARGMLPSALEQACAEHSARLVFIVSSIHCPTAVTLDEERGDELLKIIRKHDLLLLEDDVYRPISDEAQRPLVCRYPEHTIYVSSMSKCIAPGLRIGFILTPPSLIVDIIDSIRVNCWSISPLSALIATCLIESGRARDLVIVQREELRARQALLRTHLTGLKFNSSATAPHAWLQLPDHWSGEAFCQACLDNGIIILPGSAFSLSHEREPNAVRINLSAAPSREKLEHALGVIARLIRQTPTSAPND